MPQKRNYPPGPQGTDGEAPRPIDPQGRLSVLIEFRHRPGTSGAHVMGMARDVAAAFTLDEEYEPVSLRTAPTDGLEAGATVNFTVAAETYVVRGTVANEEDLEKLRARPDVAAVWIDTPIAPFPADLRNPRLDPQPTPAAAGCPIPPCDCDSGTPKGTIADVATYLGVDRIWTAGFRGTGIVVGVVDSGITAQGRPVKAGETSQRIPRVIGGWPTADWGTESRQVGRSREHVLHRRARHGARRATLRSPSRRTRRIARHDQPRAPGIQLGDQPASFERHAARPHATAGASSRRAGTRPTRAIRAIRSREKSSRRSAKASWCCSPPATAATRVPDGRCGADVGTGRSIWGANGHPLVMTVGAVNRLEQFIGYSSRGPAALDPNKPDFCSITPLRRLLRQRLRHVGRDADSRRGRRAAEAGETGRHAGRDQAGAAGRRRRTSVRRASTCTPAPESCRFTPRSRS